ncbi:MAG TPA: hypothetical protein DCE56_15065 [Cyanobacteria bacterium UBA8553]|nr:hypothetical protein [Cyanobacteria bacterium UBA8553]HAJ64316.1 hypothetical protein [Cyanobacteria bacterium UBA8543]
MQSEHLQQIIEYYIEDTKDYLNRSEKDLLDLESLLKDREKMNGLGCHLKSIKGGAAMLGLGSIQSIAQCLEDVFRAIELCGSPIQADQKLKDLLMQVFYALKDLVGHLSESSGLTDEKAAQVMSEIEPVKESLIAHLNWLVKDSCPICRSEIAIASDSPEEIPSLDDLQSLIDELSLDSSST